MVLSHALITLSAHKDFRISIIHVNHHLRKNSDKDELFVRSWCETNNIQFFVKHLDVTKIQPSDNEEAWARRERYDAFQETCEQINADWICTAHHGNDQLETMIQRIVEGSGPRGLSGIRHKRENIIRPMLNCSKEDVSAYSKENKVDFVFDESNDELTRTRNYIRHKIVPVMESRFKKLTESSVRTSETMNEIEEVIQYSLKRLKGDMGIKDAEKRDVIQLNVFQNVPLLLQVRFLLSRCDIHRSLRTDEWNRIKQFLLHSKTGTILELGDWELIRNRQEIILEKLNQENVEVTWDGKSPISIYGYEMKGCSHHTVPVFKQNPYVEYVDADKLENKSLLLRSWRPGDSFIPLGMTQRKKISDLLIDRKMDLFTKRRQVVLTADEEIVWVCGQQISETYKITPNTKQVMELTMRQL